MIIIIIIIKIIIIIRISFGGSAMVACFDRAQAEVIRIGYLPGLDMTHRSRWRHRAN